MRHTPVQTCATPVPIVLSNVFKLILVTSNCFWSPASDQLPQAEELAKHHAKQATPVSLDIDEDPDMLDRLVAAHDIAIR